MNREIKFRAWVVNDSISEMHYPEDIQMNSADAFSLWYKVGFEDAFPIKNNIRDWQKKIIWMQFTGLKDKNGKEIYEGDIIHRHMNVYWEVKFSNSAWVALPPNTDSGLWLSAYKFIECEIIGNIHENSELLK